MLKFEGKFQVGDIIRAYDFQPSHDREDSYIIGEVVDAENREHGFLAYKVIQYRHVFAGKYDASEAGTEAWIPMEIGIMEFDTRITLVAGENTRERGFDADQVRTMAAGESVVGGGA